jgi:hypothetical protein
MLPSARVRGVPGLPWAALVLGLAAWLVYRPALNRVFVMDQMWYFAELDGSTSLADGLRQYDYAATRRFWKGDDALFRPALFAWLAVGNRLFSYHHVQWNAANLALHALVALCLFHLLVTIRPSPFALPVAVLFAVLKPPLELVLWNHLGGYLLACACLAVGLAAFVRLTREEDRGSRSTALAAFAVAFAAAGLFHEVMVVIGAAAAGLVLLADHRRGRRASVGRTLLLVAPLLIFAAAYAFHLARVERFAYVDRRDVHGILDTANFLTLLPRSAEALLHWTGEVALPPALTFVPAAFIRLVKRFAFSWSSPLHVANAALCVAALVVAVRSVSRAHLRRLAPLLTLLPIALVAYASVICLGRPQREVLDTAYYLYAFGLLFVVLLYAIVDIDRLRGATAGLAGVVLAAFIVLHGGQTLEATRAIGRVNHDASAFLVRLSAFVDAHAAEPDFSFRVADHPPSLDPDVPLREGYPDDPRAVVRVRHVTEILFARYYREDRPKYIFGR